MVEFETLSEPQREIVNLRSDRSYVIQGGAGTGKTVIALHRAKKMSGEGLKTVILVHNVPLKNYIDAEIARMEIENCIVRTFNQWVYRICKVSGFEPPTGKSKYDYDYEKIIALFEENRISVPDDCRGNVIIDESQDFPPLLLRFIRLVADTVTCLIDPNQSIHNTDTSLVDALYEIDVESARTLDVNFRSTCESAAVARIFWNESGIYPASFRHGQKPVMVSCGDDSDRTRRIAEIAAKYNFKNDNVSIGVFVNGIDEGKKMYDALSDELGRRYIQYRFIKDDDKKADSDPTKIDFAKPGVKLFTYGMIKGLDFDAIVVGDNISRAGIEDDAYINMLYMTLTRATSDIYICYKDADDDGNYFLQKLKENKELCEWR